MNLVRLSETKRPGNGEVSREGYTYYWSGQSDGAHCKGVAIAIYTRLQSSVIGVTPVDECVMLVRLKLALASYLLLQCMLLPRCADLRRKKCSMSSLTIVDQCPHVTHSLSRATSV